MTIKTIDQLCARDRGKRVRVEYGGDVVEGELRKVQQYGRKDSLFAIFNPRATFEVGVGGFDLRGLRGSKEVTFL